MGDDDGPLLLRAKALFAQNYFGHLNLGFRQWEDLSELIQVRKYAE